MPPVNPTFQLDTVAPSYRQKLQQPTFGQDATGFGAKTSPFNIGNTELFKQSTQTAQQQMSGEVPGFDAQANEAREAMKMGQALRAKQIREGLMNTGMRDTGAFLQQGIADPARQDERERYSFERGLTSDRGRLGMQQQQAGQQAAQGLLGLQQAGHQFGANLGLQQAQMAQKERMQAADIASREKLGFAGLESSEKIAFAGLDVDKQRLAQDAMQFDSKLDFDRWAVQQNLNENDKQRIWEATQNEKSRELSRETLYANLSLEDRKLAQQAEQFTSRLDFDRWATQAGLDDAAATRIWQSKENLADRMSREEIAYAGLSLEEKKMAQAAEQFTDELAYKQWATQAGLDDAAADRAWRSAENIKAFEHESNIAQMQIDQDQWKQMRVEDLTRAGWTHEEALADAQREWQAAQSNLDRALTREVEQGRLSMQEKELAQQATQFESEIEFKQWATQAGLDDAAAQRVWQSTEAAKDRAQRANEFSVGTQLKREAMLQDWDAQTRALAQEASQFADEMDFKKWATQKNLDDAEQQRMWQSLENVKNRTHDAQMQQLDHDFAEKGIKLQAVIANIQNLPEKQAAEFMKNMATSLGIEMPTLTSEDLYETQLQDINDKIKSKTALDTGDLNTIVNAVNSEMEIPFNVLTKMPENTRSGLKAFGDANKGNLWVAPDGKVYRIYGVRHDTSGPNQQTQIQLEDPTNPVADGGNVAALYGINGMITG